MTFDIKLVHSGDAGTKPPSAAKQGHGNRNWGKKELRGLVWGLGGEGGWRLEGKVTGLDAYRICATNPFTDSLDQSVTQ